jgi:hypothetical protein
LRIRSERCTLALVPELLPRFHAAMQRIQDERRLGRILQETGDLPAEASASGRPLRASADGHRGDRRRGVPVISRGMAPAAQDPLRAVLAKERRGELWREGRR